MENKDNQKANNDEMEEQFDESQYEGQNTERLDEEEWPTEQQDEEVNTERQDDDEDDRLNEEQYEEQYTERRDEDETFSERKDQSVDGRREEEEHDEEENLTHTQEEQVSKRMVKENLTKIRDEWDFSEEQDEGDHFSESRQEDWDMERPGKDQNKNHREGHANILGSPNQIDSQEMRKTIHEPIGDDVMPTENQARELSRSIRGISPAFAVEATEDIKPNDPRTTSSVTKYKDAAATVRFLLMPSQQIATVRFNLIHALAELKQQIAAEMKINPQVIQLMLDGKKVSDESNLVNLGVNPNGTIQLQLHSVDPVNHPIPAFRPRQEYHMPDVITVRIPIDNHRSRDVVVEILKETGKKPWLGGYRDKRHQAVYHHAAVQTMPKPRPPPAVEQFSRDTQTTEQKNIVQQTTNETATQMTKIGTYVSCKKDRLVIPGQYTTADEFNTTRIFKAVIIQKYYRRWLAKRRADTIREAERVRREWEKQEEIVKTKEKQARIQREYERRMNPKSKEDFDLLYHALEKWRKEEEERINSTLSGAERKAALCMLLEQETQLIASIGRHKIEADSENKSRLINDFLEKAAAPKRWKGRDGKTTEMDTPYTLRAQQLKEIYNSVNMKFLTQDERLDVLLTLKHTVKEHDCKLTQEIIKLIDREADLLMRGVQENNLDGLRKRISTLFLQYIKTPLFNPEAARLLKVPQDPSSLRQNIYFCPSCTRYLPSTEFKLSSNSKTVSRCRKCIKNNNDACLRQDHGHFRHMLRRVCGSEEHFGIDSKIAFLMQEDDIRYLVENVWDSQSVLSAMGDLYELVLIRWDQKEEWSPWNCVLLTKEEASAHAKLENVNEAYGEEFLHRVKQKHTLARNHFARLPKMTAYLRSREDNTTTSAPVLAVPALPGKQMAVAPAVV